MPAIVDNLIAYRVLSMLVKPFVDTDAYKLGIIDDKGQNLIKAKDFKTLEQKDAYTFLHRLVFNIKKLLNKLPGGDSQLKNLVAALVLIRESYDRRSTSIDESRLMYLVKLLDEGIVLAEEQLVVEEFLLFEEMGAGAVTGGGGTIAPEGMSTSPTNVTGSKVSTDQPKIRKKKRFARFIVNDEVFNKFASGKTKFRKWSSYLNMEDEGQRMIYNFATKNPNGVIVLHNGKNVKAIRFNRNGGGAWSKIKRPTRQINNEITPQ